MASIRQDLFRSCRANLRQAVVLLPFLTFLVSFTNALTDVGPNHLVSSTDLSAAEKSLAQGIKFGNEDILLENYLSWGANEGVEISSAVEVVIKNDTTLFASGRSRADFSLIAAQNFVEGDIIFSVPLKLAIISSNLSSDTEALQETLLTRWILQEQSLGQSSSYHPYIRLMPSYLPLPYLFSEALLEEFQDDIVVTEVKENKKVIVDEYYQLSRASAINTSLDAFVHAWGLATSRAIPVPVQHLSTSGNETRKDLMLLPFVDLINHGEPGNVELKIAGDQVQVVASSNISKGESLQRFYGELTNQEAAMVYGFIPPNNVRSHAILFASAKQAAMYFHKHMLMGDTDWTHNYAITDSMFLIEEFIEVELKKKRYRDRMKRLEYQFQTDRPYYTWWGGRVDPRLIGGFAIIHATMINSKTFEYEDLAKAAVLYGWMSSERTTCDDMASWMDDQVSDSLPSASQAIAGRARELLMSHATTISQDIQVMNLLQLCTSRAMVNEVDMQDTPEGASLTERLRQCSVDVLPELANIEVVVLSRLAKKAVLSQLINRLLKTCEN